MPRVPLPSLAPLLLAAALPVVLFAAAATAQNAPPTPNAKHQTPNTAAPDFARAIQPLLEKRCLGCHGVGAKLGGLDLSTRAASLKGGTRGAAFVAGHAEKSVLFQMVTGKRAPLMPPTGKLPNAEIALLKQWLDSGANWPDTKIEKADKQIWWSFRPLAPVKPPALSPIQNPKSKIQNPIDLFIQDRLRKEGLTPNPPAPRQALLRRVYLDLLGLPPTPEEVAAFVADPAPDAYEKVVERLLASPHYGERWGRHWLDLARYADSSGFEGDRDRPLAWRYRDYVISAFNADKPYSDFIREQLAGDELAKVTPETLTATGYLGLGCEDFAMAKLPTTRADELDDLVATTSQVFLGLTVGCARCHDHKYDPVKQTDYYRLQALFAPTVRKDVDIAAPEEKARIDALNRPAEQELTELRAQAAPLEAQGRAKAQAAGHKEPNAEQILNALPDPDKARLADLRAKIAKAESGKLPYPKAMTVTDGGATHGPTHLLIRGDAYHPGPVVEPGFIETLPGGSRTVPASAATPTTTGRRRALADWIASPRNPLTARVWMNRVWRQHFGRGLSDSTSNVGISGELPSHPELLDWLANKFTSLGGRLKPMHRLMLLSSAYRQSSAVRPAAWAKDPQNRLLWRMPVRRLEAEPVRDGILAVSGTLNPAFGGPPVYPPVDPSLRADTFQGFNWPEGEDSPKTWRRSVYVKVKRSLLFPGLEVFDCPEITNSVARRNATTTPLQALALLNDPLVLVQAGKFAERLRRESGPGRAAQVSRAYQLALSRPPTAKEAKLSLDFLARRAQAKSPDPLADFCHAVFNLNEFVYVP